MSGGTEERHEETQVSVADDRTETEDTLFHNLLTYHSATLTSKQRFFSLYCSVPQYFCLGAPFGLRKVTTDPHILAHVNIQCPDERYPKLKIYISELILDS